MQQSADVSTLIPRAGVMLLNECLDMVGGNYPAASMLSQLLYWYTPSKTGQIRLRILRDGHFWVVKTHTDWSAECRLTRRQVNRATALLKAKGLICTEVHGFKGHKATFTRLLEAALIPFALHQVVQKEGGYCTKGCNALHQGVHSNTVDFVQETTSSSTGGGDEMKINGGKTGLESEKVKEMLLSKEKLKKSIPLNNLKKNASALSEYWRGWLVERYPELKLQTAMTLKEQSQLAKLVKALGANPLVALRWAIFNWEAFKARLSLDHGKAVTAKYPHIGLLCMYPSTVLHAQEVSVQLIAQAPVPKTFVAAAPVKEKKKVAGAYFEEVIKSIYG